MDLLREYRGNLVGVTKPQDHEPNAVAGRTAAPVNPATPKNEAAAVVGKAELIERLLAILVTSTRGVSGGGPVTKAPQRHAAGGSALAVLEQLLAWADGPPRQAPHAGATEPLSGARAAGPPLRITGTTRDPAWIEIKPPSASIVVGTRQSFTAVMHYFDGSAQDETEAVEWSCSPPDALLIGSKGLGTALRPALRVELTAKDINSGVIGRTSVRVTAPELVAISISPHDCPIPFKSNQQFRATGHFSDGSNRYLDSEPVIWRSLNDNAVHMKKDGSALGRNSGQSTITATYRGVTGSTEASVSSS
jgi:hypothetical protein